MVAGHLCGASAGLDLDLHRALAAFHSDRHGKGGTRDRRVDGFPVAPDEIRAAVYDHLRRVDPAASVHGGIAPLPRGILRIAQRVAPAEIVPIVDMQRERDHVGSLGKLREEAVGGDAGGAALAGEELHDRLWRGRLRTGGARHRRERDRAHQQTRNDASPLPHWLQL